MLTIAVKEVSDCLTEVALTDWPSYEEAEVWELFKKLFILEYFRYRDVWILTDDAEWSIGRVLLPNERVTCLVPRPTRKGRAHKARFLIIKASGMTMSLSTEIVESIDFSIGLLWMSSHNFHEHICELVSNLTGFSCLIDYLKEGTFAFDLLISQDDANCLLLYRPLERVSDLASRVAAYFRTSLDWIG